ncbi:response regulator [Aestuariivirga litoralis]|uniref:response regulator n=1 Tax=Aestuariivirga litoralis TaxID=2650924 RepID=UPI0018C6A80B|nr:response regulator [Aestuariivirga litoralis]MBG1233213.1 response regulator [Aestuariivirga litoralis]
MPFAQQLRVMVADDTTVSRMLICDGLWSFGIKDVQVAQDGEQALKLMMTSPCHLVISDYNMPKMDGIQLLQALRQNAPTKSVGFILVTGRGDRALIESGKRFGLNNFLPKPFTNESLRLCVEQVVGKLT